MDGDGGYKVYMNPKNTHAFENLIDGYFTVSPSLSSIPTDPS